MISTRVGAARRSSAPSHIAACPPGRRLLLCRRREHEHPRHVRLPELMCPCKPPEAGCTRRAKPSLARAALCWTAPAGFRPAGGPERQPSCALTAADSPTAANHPCTSARMLPALSLLPLSRGSFATSLTLSYRPHHQRTTHPADCLSQHPHCSAKPTTMPLSSSGCRLPWAPPPHRRALSTLPLVRPSLTCATQQRQHVHAHMRTCTCHACLCVLLRCWCVCHEV